MIILGLNVFHADTSACLVKNGELIAAVEEERFTRIKHFTGFPKNSIDFCLKEAELKIEDVDYICVNYNTSYNLKEKIFFSLKNFYTSNFFRKAFFSLRKKSLSKLFIKFYDLDVSKKVKFIPHHLAHIASTFYFNKVENSLGFSFDGSGDFSTVEVFKLGKKIELLEKVNYPNSLGIFYQAFTQFLGFKNYGDEYKVMGLASYGEPIYKDRILKILKSKNKFFELNLNYFDHHQSVIDYDFESGYPFFDDLYSSKIEKLFGKSRSLNQPIEKIHKDIASSLQAGFEEVVIKKLNAIKIKYKDENLCIAGGCAFNSSLNGKIIEKSDFKNIYFSPNVGDAGGAIGAALFIAKENDEKIKIEPNPFLGTYYSNEYIEKKIIQKIKNMNHYDYDYYEDLNDLNNKVSKKLANEGVVGWFQDRMEWGPRALGNRSILGDPRNPNMREIINIKIKRREEFRPFAPSVLSEKASEYFKIKIASPYMCSVFDVIEEKKHEIPAVVHVDGTARVQTVEKNMNEKFYNLIKNFGDLTGVPIILNTSLNVEEPICENPENALEIFSKTSMDMLVLQNWVLTKK
ncbi:carbamoyltransferase [Pelagibacteraceae bacterium]|nr:carbamoyltransferase [Pelagibacteraceae bacterium]